MILKFTTIKNVGRFRKFAASGDQTLRKVNLFFGENGRGKTTIAAILRSLRSGKAHYIHERKTLGNSDPVEIEVLLQSTGMAKFNGTSWSQVRDGIEIFDHRYIVNTIHIGESVETTNKRNLASVILGQKGGEISRRIKANDEIARDKLAETTKIETAMKAHIPEPLTVQQFLDLDADADIDTKIAVKERDLEAGLRASSLKAQSLLTPLPLPALPIDFGTTLAKTIGTVSASAEQKVRAHLASEHMADAEEWLSEGVAYMDGALCPVCGRSAQGVDLITAYKDYFSKEYETLRDEVNELEEGLAVSLGNKYEQQYSDVADKNKGPLAFWKELVSVSLPVVPDINVIAAARNQVLSRAQEHLRKKQTSLLESVDIGSMTSVLKKLEAACAEVVAYNAAVDAANVQIAALKAKAEVGSVSTLRAELARLKAIKARYSTEIAVEVALREKCRKERADAVAARASAQEELATYSKEVVGACEKRINEILTDFATGFRIAKVDTDFPAGMPASSYSIVINGEAVEVGKPVEAQPSFQTMLSAGDKSALALAFFFAIVEQDANRANKIIFLDDPFNSQDEHRANQTCKLILKYAAECEQIIVSSHDPDFLRNVWNLDNTGSIKCLKLALDGADDTTITEWDIEQSTKYPYLRSHDDLTQYMAGALALSPADVIQKLRPLLEQYIRFRFPNMFKRNDWLGDMIARFKREGTGHPMFEHVTALTDINDYTSPAHHSTQAINETELRTYVQKTLHIVGET